MIWVCMLIGRNPGPGWWVDWSISFQGVELFKTHPCWIILVLFICFLCHQRLRKGSYLLKGLKESKSQTLSELSHSVVGLEECFVQQLVWKLCQGGKFYVCSFLIGYRLYNTDFWTAFLRTCQLLFGRWRSSVGLNHHNSHALKTPSERRSPMVTFSCHASRMATTKPSLETNVAC